MYSYRVVIRIKDRKEKGKLIEHNEYYVANSFDRIYKTAIKSTEIIDGELIAIIRQDPIVHIYKG